MLENDQIKEEHRSNILGQIWAKGERIGISEAIEYIDQKEQELLLPSDIAEQFRQLVNKFTTRR